jgi:hypothetical protein
MFPQFQGDGFGVERRITEGFSVVSFSTSIE